MCGIVGAVDTSSGLSRAALLTVAERLAQTLRHRGPDDAGAWTDPESGVSLGHARLSILDVSTCGHQPMVSHDGRYVLVFNGEIYNFRRIRSRLRALGTQFRSDSDTEVLVEAIAQWGTRDAVAQAVGMFAFAVWDRAERTLVLGRDRMGEKPLYYGWLGRAFVFASELKAMREHPQWGGVIDRAALTLYLRHGYIPGPHTIYRGIAKLPPGSLLRMNRWAAGALPQPEPYWELRQAADVARDVEYRSDEDAICALERLIGDAVGQQMVADVPLGAFLSGGIDSATVVALMQAQSDRPVRTFTIGVDDGAHDEAPAARAIARHLGTEHTEAYARPEDALEIVPQLGRIYDEPFADSSQIPTLLVSRLARRFVTVSLSGDGGDELFGGYATYGRGPYLASKLRRVPASVRRSAGRVLLAPPVSDAIAILSRRDGGLLADRAMRLGEILQESSPLAIHRALYSHWLQPARVVVGGTEPPTVFTSSGAQWQGRSFAERMLLTDAITYLPDDLLVKVDRAAMSVSLETRVPLLDHRIVEFAARLPWEMKVRGGVRKWILRQVLYRHVPKRLVDRPKTGFSVPVAQWLRGPLRGWAAALLDRDRIADEGIFRPGPIWARWTDHLKGTCDWSYPLWAVLMFQAWSEAQSQRSSPRMVA